MLIHPVSQRKQARPEMFGGPNLLWASSGIQPIDYLVVFVYLGIMLSFGWYFSRRQETVEDYFVAGRRMPWLAAGLSMIATLMSTLSYLGTPGEMIQHGIGLGFSYLALPFAFLVVAFLWVPFFMRLRLTSAYEYLERRFGTGTRLVAVVLYLYMRLVWMGAIIFTASRAIAQITEDTAPLAIASLTGNALRFDPTSWFYFVLLATGVIATVYTTLGGIKAVIWTDIAQFLVLFAGAVATLAIVAASTRTGPADWWRATTSVAHQIPPIASWDLSTRVAILWTFLSGLMWHVCTHASDQVALQRYFTTPSASAAQRTALVNYLVDLTMQLLLALVGMALLTYYLNRPEALPLGVTDPRSPDFADRIFPRFIAYGLPVGVSGLVVAALFAAAQSSIDSGINSTATVLLTDVVRRFLRRNIEPARELALARALTLAIGAFITTAALVVSLLPSQYNIIDLQMKSFNCVLGPLGAIFMSGMLLRHVGQAAIIPAGIIGAASGLAFGFMDMIPGVRAPTPYLIVTLSWAVTMLLAAVLGGFLPGPRPEQVRGLCWRDVVLGDGTR
jgi:SSS family transporter